MVARQARASGGIWLCLRKTELLLDPGPGSLVRATSSRHRLDPTRLAGIFLSHRHLDHAGDVNNMIEAMTMGGTQPRGILFAPRDALEGDDPVVLRYLRSYLAEVVTLHEGGTFRIGAVDFECPVRHRHSGEVYGARFCVPGLKLSYIADTRFFSGLADAYRADVVIFNVVRYQQSDLYHLHVPEVEELVGTMKPKLSILTHFGMTMLRARPRAVAEEMSEKTGCKVMAASDGMKVSLGDIATSVD